MLRRRPVRAALLVDFDNIVPSVTKTLLVDRAARWTEWLERGGFDEDLRPRKLLVKRCYWNRTAEVHRSYFEDAGYVVIPTPSLTRAKKSSADIQIAIDAIDSLARKERIEEFIILSGDSDFTPLAKRLKEAERRVVVFSDENTVDAYVESADLAIDRDALRKAAEAPRPPRARNPFHLIYARLTGRRNARTRGMQSSLGAIAQHMFEDLKSRNASVMGAARFRRLCERLEGFETEGDGAWFACGDEDALIAALVAKHESLELHDDPQGRRTLKLAPGVLRTVGRRRGRKPRNEALSFDLDSAAARLADAARRSKGRAIGKVGVRRALASQPGFSDAGAQPWLGFMRYRDMIEGLVSRRADLALEPCPGGGAVVRWARPDRATDAALERALQVIAQCALPLRVDAFAERLVEAGGLEHWAAGGWRDAEDFARLLKRLQLAGLEVSSTPEPGLISDPGAGDNAGTTQVAAAE